MDTLLSEAVREVQSSVTRLSSVPEDELTHFIANEMKRCTYPAGTHFTRPGDTSSRVGFVLQGLFRVFYIGHDGAEHVRNFCRRGTPIGAYGAILAGSPSNVAIQALQDSVVLECSHATMFRQFEVSSAWERLGRRIAESHYISRERREHALLTMDAFGRLQRFREDFADIAPFLKRADIASYLGIRPETLSRMGHRPPMPPPSGS